MSLFGSKKQNEIDKLISENDELKNQLHSILLKQGGYEEFEKNLIRVKEELTEASQKLENLTKDNSSLDFNKTDKEKYLGDLNSKILDLEEIKENLNGTIQSYNAQVALLEERGKELDEKLALSTEIEIKLADLKDKKEKLNIDIADKEQAFAYLSTIEREIQTELEKERNDCDTTREQAENLRNEIFELNAEIEEKKKEFEKLVQDEEDAAQRINRIKEDEARKTAQIKNLEERISLNEEIKNNLESNLGNFISQFNNNEKLYHEQASKKEILSDEVLKLQKERDELEYKLDFAKNQFEVFQSEAAKHTNIISSLGDEIRKIESMRETMQGEVNDLTSSIEKLTAEIAETRNTLDALEKRKSDLEEINLNTELDFISITEKFKLELTEALKNKTDLEQDINNKRSEAAGIESSLAEKNARISLQEGMLQLLEKEKSSLEKFIAEYSIEKNKLTETVFSLKENISKNNSLLSSLHYENETLQIKKADIQRDLSFLMAQISREYSDAENKLRNINEEISGKLNILNNLNEKIAAGNTQNNQPAEIDEIKEIEAPKRTFFRLTEFEKNSDMQISEDQIDNDNPHDFGINPLNDDLNDD